MYERALVLALARVDGTLVGVGAIKRPNPSHREKVFKKAESLLSPAIFAYELGWFHVLPRFEGNGICSRMVQGVMRWTDGSSVYATSTIGNVAMHAALMKHGGFVKEGIEYASELSDDRIRLFVKPA